MSAPRQQLYIVGGIAAVFAILALLFIILFATKKCDKCTSAGDFSSVVAQAPNTRDAASIRAQFEKAGYSIYKITNLPSNNGQSMVIVSVKPANNATQILADLAKVNVTTVTVYGGDGSPSIPVCPVAQATTTAMPATTTVGTTTPAPTDAQGSPITKPPPTPTIPAGCPTAQPQGTVCSSTVKEVIFAIDVLPDIGSSKNKFSQIQSVISSFGSSLNLNNAFTRIGIIGFDSSTTLYHPLHMIGSQSGFTDEISHFFSGINRGTPASVTANIGTPFNSLITTSNSNSVFRSNVDRLVIVISDHIPLATDTNGNSNNGYAISTALQQQGFYVAAINPVFKITGVTENYKAGIVSNPALYSNDVTGYDDPNFATTVNSFFMKAVCGYVANAAIPVPTTTVTTTTPATTTNTASTTTGPTSSTTLTTPTTTFTTTISSTTTAMATTTTPPIYDTNKCQIVDILFILDRSQSIFDEEYNVQIKNFVLYITKAFSMLQDVPLDYKNAMARVGVIQFADTAELTIPFAQRTHDELEKLIEQKVIYTNQGTTNIKDALQLAVETVNNSASHVVAILITDAVSTLDIDNSAVPAAALRQAVKAFMGVEVNGINGNLTTANTTNMVTLIGNAAYAYASIPAAQNPTTGVLPEVLSAYPCPLKACKGVIFIGEFTEVIAQDRKVMFLTAARQIAKNLDQNPGTSATETQLRFSIAQFGEGIYRHIALQQYADFDTTIAQAISLARNNTPNGGQTFTAPILTELNAELLSGDLSNYMVIFMGESEAIIDYDKALAQATVVGSSRADVYVLDMTECYSTPCNRTQEAVFKAMVSNDPLKIKAYNEESADKIATYYNNLLTNKFASLSCIAPPPGRCNNVFDITFIVQQPTAATVNITREIANYLNTGFVSAGNLNMKSIIVGTAPPVTHQLTFDSNAISDIINGITASAAPITSYGQYFSQAKTLLTDCKTMRTFAQNLVLFISDTYPTNDAQCTTVISQLNAWKTANLIQSPYVYYITSQAQPANAKPCSNVDPSFNIIVRQFQGNNIDDNGILDQILMQICDNSSQRTCPCPCDCNAGACTNKKSFFTRYFD